jgi:hypothetical protein
VKQETLNVYFTRLNSPLDQILTCTVDCGSPAFFTYTWTFPNNSFIFNNSNTEQMYSNYYLSQLNIVPDSKSSAYEVVCTVSNGQNSLYRQESQTRYLITYQEQGKTRRTMPLFFLLLISNNTYTQKAAVSCLNFKLFFSKFHFLATQTIIIHTSL